MTMPSNIQGHTLIWKKHFKGSPSSFQTLFQKLNLDSLVKYGIITKKMY